MIGVPAADELIAVLRAEGSDTQSIEAKRAEGGWPSSLLPTLSSFSNLPGGGTVLLGVDESGGFAVNGVGDAAALQQQLSNVARTALDPPVSLASEAQRIGGRDVVVAAIHEADASVKPVRIKRSGKAYLRSYDGDYELSVLEEQAFLANRTTPTFDRQVVDGATPADLDDELVASYLLTCRESSRALAGFGDDELLFRTGVLIGDARTPSLAGLLALGRYPQQYFPSLVIQAKVQPRTASERAIDPRRFDGPLPFMLRDALAWLRRNSGSRVVFGRDGHGRDVPEYPAEAMRELIANALVHRDYGPHAAATAITLTVQQERVVISNPGGLFGIRVSRLGQEGMTSTRNSTLVRICQNVRFDGDRRVCEALASGIPQVFATLREAGMAPPRFFDQGTSFTVSVPSHALIDPDDLQWLASLPETAALRDTQRHALVLLRRGEPLSNASYRARFPMDSRDAQRELAELAERGLVVADGERGGRTYRLAAPTVLARVSGPRRQLLDLLESAPQSVRQLSASTGLDARQVRYQLHRLRDQGVVAVVRGGRGRRDTLWGVVGGRLPFE